MSGEWLSREDYSGVIVLGSISSGATVLEGNSFGAIIWGVNVQEGEYSGDNCSGRQKFGGNCPRGISRGDFPGAVELFRGFHFQDFLIYLGKYI